VPSVQLIEKNDVFDNCMEDLRKLYETYVNKLLKLVHGLLSVSKLFDLSAAMKNPDCFKEQFDLCYYHDVSEDRNKRRGDVRVILNHLKDLFDEYFTMKETDILTAGIRSMSAAIKKLLEEWSELDVSRATGAAIETIIHEPGLYHELGKGNLGPLNDLGNPKFRALCEVLDARRSVFSNGGKAVIFVESRKSAESVSQLIEEHYSSSDQDESKDDDDEKNDESDQDESKDDDDEKNDDSPLRCTWVVGHAAGAENGMSQREQQRRIDRFRSEGDCNVLVSTSVTEEGIDISECMLVVRYDSCNTVRQFVQSRGRARHPDSEFVCLGKGDIVNLLESERLMESEIRQMSVTFGADIRNTDDYAGDSCGMHRRASSAENDDGYVMVPPRSDLLLPPSPAHGSLGGQSPPPGFADDGDESKKEERVVGPTAIPPNYNEATLKQKLAMHKAGGPRRLLENDAKQVIGLWADELDIEPPTYIGGINDGRANAQRGPIGKNMNIQTLRIGPAGLLRDCIVGEPRSTPLQAEQAAAYAACVELHYNFKDKFAKFKGFRFFLLRNSFPPTPEGRAEFGRCRAECIDEPIQELEEWVAKNCGGLEFKDIFRWSRKEECSMYSYELEHKASQQMFQGLGTNKKGARKHAYLQMLKYLYTSTT
jgi:hypothetical protein